MLLAKEINNKCIQPGVQTQTISSFFYIFLPQWVFIFIQTLNFLILQSTKRVLHDVGEM